MYRKIAFLLKLTLILCVLVSCKEKQEPKDKKQSGKQRAITLVEGVVLKPEPVSEIISISGTLKPFEETILMPDLTGRVVNINLPEGKFVKQGTLLVKLFDEDLQAQLRRSEAQLKIAEEKVTRQSQLVNIEGISRSDYDQTVLQVSSIKGDIGVLKAQIRKTEIIAPFDGVIGLRNVSVGAIVTPSTSLATLRQVNKLKLDFSVPGKYSGAVKANMKISFSVQGDEKKYFAKVIATEEGIDMNTRNFKARAIVEANSPSLVPGAFSTVELKVRENPQALVVPTQAIIPQELVKRVIVCKNKKAVFVPVKTGVRQSSNIEVLSGLNAGDTVVTTGILFIKPGAVLKFSKVNN